MKNKEEKSLNTSKDKKAASKRALPITIRSAIITGVFVLLASMIGVISVNINTNNSSPTQFTPTTNETPPTPLSAEDQFATLMATVTKSAELTATQSSIEMRKTAEVELTVQQLKNELIAQQTQYALETAQSAEQTQFVTSTAIANITATAQAADIWQEQHQFIDEFTDNNHGWNGESKSTNVSVNPSTGILNFETKKESRIAFWKCDECSIPTDHGNYSFEVKYYAPKANTDFNFGLLFGCSQFDEELVSCQAIQLVNQNYIRVVKTGTSKEYQVSDYYIAPNEKGLVSVRWEVTNQKLKLWINNQIVMNNIDLDGGASGFFGFYCDPPGYKVDIERVEIYPLP